MTTILQAALAYAARGWLVHPINPDTKRPWCNWRHGDGHPEKFSLPTVPLADDPWWETWANLPSTTDERTIRAWWIAKPGAGVGVQTGRQSGIVVIDQDVDAGKGIDGGPGLARLEARCGVLPATVEARTPRGGRHLYFKFPVAWRKVKTTAKIGDEIGVDVRGDGGQVPAPPTLRGAGAYSWVPGRAPTEIALAELPDRWREVLEEPAQPPAPPRRSGYVGISPGEGTHPWVRAMVEATLADLAAEPQGGQSVRLFWTARRHAEFERWIDGPIEAGLVDAAKANGLWEAKGERHCMGVIRSGMEKGRAHPLDPPEPAPQVDLSEWPRSPAKAPVPTEGTRFPFPGNDLENAERFVREHGEMLRYVYPWDAWPAWDGRRWNRDVPHVVEGLAAQTTRDMLREAVAISNDDERKRALKHASSTHANGKRKAMIESAQHMLFAEPSDFDSSPWLLNVTNGILDLRTGELGPHRPDAMLARLADVAYHEDAKAPTWLGFLDRVLDHDTELIAFVQRAIGYTLTGSRREQCMFLMIGATGCNGKSVFIKVLSSILGDYHSDIAFKTLLFDSKGHGKDPELAELDGPRLVTAAEPNPGERLDESLIKRLTGGDPITAARKYERPVTFDPVCKLWVACNAPPRLMTGGNAMRRRLSVIPFDVTIPPEEQDEDLSSKLLAERDGILAWAVEGCLSWQESGLRMPERVTEARDNYIEDSDPISEWLATLTRRQGDKASMKIVYNSYKQHVEAAGHHPKDAKALADLLREHGYGIQRSHGMRWLMDVSAPEISNPDRFQEDFASGREY